MKLYGFVLLGAALSCNSAVQWDKNVLTLTEDNFDKVISNNNITLIEFCKYIAFFIVKKLVLRTQIRMRKNLKGKMEKDLLLLLQKNGRKFHKWKIYKFLIYNIPLLHKIKKQEQKLSPLTLSFP